MSKLFSVVMSFIATFSVLGNLKEAYYAQLYDVELYEEYDFIVVGSGSAGSIVASRLSEHPNITVLLIEAGQSGRGDVNIETPFFYQKLFGTSKDWNYFTEPLTNAYSQRSFYTRGKMGGGTGSLNSMYYFRGTKLDFDSWENLGAKGWGYEDVLPFFQKIEKSSDPNLPCNLGKNGKIPLTRSYSNPKMFQFVKRLADELKIPFKDYLSYGNICEGFSNATSNILKGIRQSSAVTYLWPSWEQRKSRLHLAFGALAHKVLLQDLSKGKKAYGIRFEHKGKVKEVRARKEIILSAGSINSPQLLMLSGIGPKKHLQDMNIKPEVDLPGVGSNLHDHMGIILHYYGTRISKDLITTNEQALLTFPDYVLSGTGPLSSAGLTSTVAHFSNFFIRNEKIPRSCRPPDMQIWFSSLEMDAANWPMINATKFNNNFKRRNGVLSHMTIALSLARPKSRGTIRLASSDVKVPPKIDLNYFDNAHDMESFIAGFRILEKFEKSRTFQNIKLKLVVNKNNAKKETKIPRSEAFYEHKVKQEVLPFMHASSTNKIGKSTDKKAVVDPNLCVYGVEGLRIADASVMPHLVSVNPQGTVFMIAEKASYMILKDWGLSPSY